MMRRILTCLLRGLLGAIIGLLLVFGLPRLVTGVYSRPRIYGVENAPAQPVAIVFGAGLSRSGGVSAVLRDRVETAVRLYQDGRVEKILMSGDNRFENYNEPGAMREYALELGIPDEDIVLDFAGRRTYDTCYRARHIFGIRQAIVVTQSFHIPRALYLCNHLGVESAGVPADVRRYGRRSYAYWNLRETAATTVALWQVWVTRPLPVLGQPEPIFPLEGAEGMTRPKS
jgi:SanA protein